MIFHWPNTALQRKTPGQGYRLPVSTRSPLHGAATRLADRLTGQFTATDSTKFSSEADDLIVDAQEVVRPTGTQVPRE